MMRIAAWALAVAFLLAGCTAPDAPEDLGEMTAAPGTTAHLFVQIDASGPVALEVSDSAGLNVTAPDALHDSNGTAAGWIGVDVAADAAPGEHEVLLDAEGADAPARLAIRVHVEEPTDPLGQGVVALVNLTLRTADGTLAATNRADVDASPLPRVEDYQAPQQAEPQPLPLSPQQLPPEIVGPLAAASVGQSLTIAMPEFFGPAATEQERPREETVPREEILQRFQEMPREAAEQQGFIDASTQEGDTLAVGGPVPYVVETLNSTTLRAEVDLEEGDRITLHDAWPDATVAQERSADEVVLRTDPPVAQGERFTWDASWPDATEIVSMNDTQVVLRHSPDEGMTYETRTRQGQVAETTVAEVGPETITLSQQNPHPMGGETVLIEMTVVGQEAPAQAPGPGPAGP